MKSDLDTQHCEACEGLVEALNPSQIEQLMPQLDKHWEVCAGDKKIKRSFKFNNFYETMSFVNAVAWIANTENHHPDLEIGYNYCDIYFMTHALQGLSHNDFICASKVDKIFTL